MRLHGRLLVLSAVRTARRAAKERRRELRAELSMYCSAPDRADLSAVLDRCPDAQTEELRDLLWQVGSARPSAHAQRACGGLRPLQIPRP